MAAPPKPLSVDIHTATKDGDMKQVYEFLEEGGDVNVRCRSVFIVGTGLELERGRSAVELAFVKRAQHKHVSQGGLFPQTSYRKNNTDVYFACNAEFMWSADMHRLEHERTRQDHSNEALHVFFYRLLVPPFFVPGVE